MNENEALCFEIKELHPTARDVLHEIKIDESMYQKSESELNDLAIDTIVKYICRKLNLGENYTDDVLTALLGNADGAHNCSFEVFDVHPLVDQIRKWVKAVSFTITRNKSFGINIDGEDYLVFPKVDGLHPDFGTLFDFNRLAANHVVTAFRITKDEMGNPMIQPTYLEGDELSKGTFSLEWTRSQEVIDNVGDKDEDLYRLATHRWTNNPCDCGGYDDLVFYDGQFQLQF